MTTTVWRVSAYVLFTLVITSTPCLAGTSTISVDLDTSDVSPSNPAVNLWSADTITLKVSGKEDRSVYVAVDVTKPADDGITRASDPETYRNDNTVEGREVAITYRRCNDPDFPTPTGEECPAIHRSTTTSSWIIWTPPTNFILQIFTAAPGDNYLTFDKTVVIEVEQRPFALGWSAGFAGFVGAKDHQYRVAASDGGSEMASLQRLSDDDLPYKVAAFAHYFPYRWKGIHGPAFGLSTDVPVEELSILLGWSVALRTLPIGDGAYLTAGVAYTPRERLRPEYEGLEEVSASLTSDALLEDDYGLGGFVAVSFGFWGGKAKFQGVFPGSGGSE